MKASKHLCIFFLIACVFLFSFTANADTIIEKDGFEFTQTITGRIILKKYSGYDMYLTIPKTVLNNPVNEIGNNAFYFNFSIWEVTIPEGISTIGFWAFHSCSNLRKVYVPGSVYYIDLGAFDNCPKLVLYGPDGSYVQRYAERNSIPFVRTTVIDDPTDQPDQKASYPLTLSSYAKIELDGAFPRISLMVENISSFLTVDKLTIAFAMQDSNHQTIYKNGTNDIWMFKVFNTPINPSSLKILEDIELEGYDGVKYIDCAISNVRLDDGREKYLKYDELDLHTWVIENPIYSNTPTPTVTLTPVPTPEPTPTPTTVPDPSSLPGDANDDGIVDEDDIVVLIDYFVSGKIPDSVVNANANSLGEIDLLDLIWIVDQLLDR